MFGLQIRRVWFANTVSLRCKHGVFVQLTDHHIAGKRLALLNSLLYIAYREHYVRAVLFGIFFTL